MADDLHLDDHELHQLGAEGAHQFATEVMDEARDMAPILDLVRTRPPGEGWSMPPGAARRSLDIYDTTGIDGPETWVIGDPVWRFVKKRRHAIRDPFTPAVIAVADRWAAE